MEQTRGIISLRKKIAVGYALIIVLIGGIVGIYLQEWRQLEALNKEADNISTLRQNVHEAYVRIVQLSMMGETVMEWDTIHSNLYHTQRLEIDSLLNGFRKFYPHQRIDSLRRLLADKEEQLIYIAEMMEQQYETHEQIARQIPVITHRITKQPEKKKGGGFLGLFKKKQPENNTTAPIAMLHSLNNKVISRQQRQSRQLAEHVDSLTTRNDILNMKLQQLINQMDTKVQHDMLQREQAIAATRERGYIMVGSLTVFVLIMLILSYIIICRDTTRIRRYKVKTDGLIRKLEHAVRENKELLAARRKIMFTVTHELRTPLTAINGYAELIAGETGPERYTQYADTIRQASTRMVSMLNTLLGFFRLDCGKEQANPSLFHMQSITDILKTEFMPQAEDKGIALEVEGCGDAVVNGDKERIIQIGNNLLSNAMKFTEKGTVALKTEYGDNIFTLTVSDTGTGISERQQQQIFMPFERLSNAATKDGFGLGLSIVMNIVKMLDGTIDLQSTHGEGSTFTVRLPLPLADSMKVETERNVLRRNTRQFSVLALDNDEVLLSMTRDMFASNGIGCHTCTDVEQLLEQLRTRRYDLLITDLKMAGINGYDVLELLRTSHIGNSRRIPVILSTASGACVEEDVLKAGFSALLNKPFSVRELMETALKCVGTVSQQEELDFSSLVAYGNKADMLNKIISETEKDMLEFENAGKRNDRKALDEWVHHLRSSWVIIHADRPLWSLYTLLHDSPECTYEELSKAVDAVLLKGKDIVAGALKKRKEATDGTDNRD